MNSFQNKYIFFSERLGFRNWVDEDLPIMAQINADPRVMEFFPEVQTLEQTAAFINRMQDQFLRTAYCYFAVEELATQQLIGFIGLMYKENLPHIRPGVDIGWRLSTQYWNKGYALEGAKACLDYAFTKLQLESILSIAPVVNTRSEKIMKRLGMHKIGEFKHPDLTQYPQLETCVLYTLSQGQWNKTI